VSPIFSIGVKLTGEFTSLEEPTDDSDIATDAVFSADGPDFVGSERRVVPKDPTQKFRLPIVNSISWSKFTNTRVRVGG
jgi:hypothetical protein